MNPTINSLAKGQKFFDAVPCGQEDFLLRFLSGLEVQVAWSSQGPEVKDHRYIVAGVLGERALQPQFQYVSGKTVSQVLTDGRQLIISFTDGHELRSDFRRSGPVPVAVDAKVRLLSPLRGVQGTF